jgi:hypothetical protein
MGFFHSAFLELATAPTTARGSAILPAPPGIFLPIQTDVTPRSSAIYMKPAVHDFSQEAIGFFTSIRVPAALIAGSSLGALFVMMRTATQPEKAACKRNLITVFIYHTLSLLSLLLSLNVIVTATSASNTLLIQNVNPLARSAYEVLMREMKFEYLTTRWSFYASLLCFLKAVLFRALLGFDLLRKDRLRPALLVTFSVTSLFAHVLHVSGLASTTFMFPFMPLTYSIFSFPMPDCQ